MRCSYCINISCFDLELKVSKYIQMRCFARFGTICTNFKSVKNTHRGALLLKKMQTLSL